MRTLLKKLHKKLSRQDGQALPMALVALILAALVVGPFLSYGSTSLIATRVRDEIVDAQYSADAGAEDAIWNLLYGDFATVRVPDENNTYSYTLANTVDGQDDDPVNSLLPDITVTKVQADVADDDFNSGGWSGGTGWRADWANSGSSGVVTNNSPYEGSHHLELKDDYGRVERSADLSGKAYLHLTFWAKADSFEAGEEAYCEVSPNGTDWTTVWTWVDGDDDDVYREYDIDLTSFAPYTSQFYVAFEANLSGGSDYLYVDAVDIGRNFDAQPGGGSGDLASDNFNSGGWAGGTGWLADWTHTGDSEVITDDGNSGPYEGTHHLRLRRATGYVERAADLSGQSGLHLEFWAKARSFESGEEAYCKISDNGTDWNTVQTWVNGDDDDTYHPYDIDLSSYAPYSAQFYVAFEADMSGAGDQLYVDDLKITTGGAGGGGGGGAEEYVYTFRGNDSTDFWQYDVSLDSWSAVADAPGAVKDGGSLVSDGDDYIYALRGNASNNFWRYSRSGDSWNAMANTPSSVNLGGALAYDGTYIYALRGNDSTDFWQYDVSLDSWSAVADAPGAVKDGGSLVSDGDDYIYALRGNDSNAFWRYSILGNSWSSMPNAPGNVKGGGALAYDGTDVYAFQGEDTTSFWQYDVSGDSWGSMPDAPGNVKEGGALVCDGAFYVYAVRGNDSTDFWRYSISGNNWSPMAAAPGLIKNGGALAYYGTAGAAASGYYDIVSKAGSVTVNVTVIIDAGALSIFSWEVS